MKTKIIIFIVLTIPVLIITLLYVYFDRFVSVVYYSPRNKYLATIDVSQKGNTVDFNFMFRELQSDIVMAFPENKVNKNYTDVPSDWSLVIDMQISESDTGNIIFYSRLDKDNVGITNWHESSFSVILRWQKLSSNCKPIPAKQYKVTMNVIQPYARLGKADIYFHWLEEKTIGFWD